MMSLAAPSILLSLCLLFPAQSPVEPSYNPQEPRDVRLANGRLQRDEIVKADHVRNVEDARELVRLSEALKSDLDKQGEHVLSLALIRRTEQIEKLARRIRSRMKRP